MELEQRGLDHMAERRIVIFEWMTADGYFAGMDGNLDWVVPDDAQARAAANEIGRFDTVLFGRRIYEQFAGFWPRVLDDDDSATVPDPHRPGRRSREHRTIAVALDAMTKLVFSRTLKEPGWRNSHILRSFDPRAIEAMKQQPGKDMIVFGSGSIVSQLTEHGLIDEYQLVACPVFIGQGRPLLGGVSRPVRLNLIDAAKYESGDLMLRYARVS
jgi:dihydrofolate reductase